MTTALPTSARGEQEPADAALMARVAAGDEAAFELLYARHARAVHAFVLAHLGRPAEAEDVCQEAFLALWRHAARFDPRRGGVRAWLIGIARNQAISRLRAETRRARAEGAAAVAAEALGPPEDPVARAGAGRAEAARVRRLLDDVPAEQRDLLLLVHCGGVSQREIAEVTGLPLGTVKSRVRLALARVREAVEATPAAPPGAWRSRRSPAARPRRRAAAGRAAAA